MATRLQYLKLHALLHSLWPVLSYVIYCYKSKINIETIFYKNKKLDV